jgi:hypothetical protein
MLLSERLGDCFGWQHAGNGMTRLGGHTPIELGLPGASYIGCAAVLELVMMIERF